VCQTQTSYEEGCWWQDEGHPIYDGDTADENFGAQGMVWRINFRVAELDSIVAQHRSAGNESTADPETYSKRSFLPSPRSYRNPNSHSASYPDTIKLPPI
jgi:hypothetical protein